MRRVRPAGKERGASIVELALIAPVMVLLVFGVLDLGRAYRMQIRLENAAREGAAFAQGYPNRVQCPTGEDIEQRVFLEDSGIAAMPAVVSVYRNDPSLGMTEMPKTCDGTAAGPGDRIRVAVAAPFDVLTPVVERVVGDTIEITGAAEIEVPT